MILRTIRLTFIAAVATLFLLGSLGCSNRPASAQKLFEQGEYQKVIDRYPELEIARRAHAKLGEVALQQKNLAVVLKDFWDTPAAYQAKMMLAQQMFDQGRYRALLDSFPQSPLAVQAKEKLADSLYAAGQMDNLIQLYPETQKAKLVKEDRCKDLLTKAKKLRGDQRRLALEEIVRSYGGTEGSREAGELLAKVREADQKKKK